MTTEDVLKNAKGGIALIGEVIKAAGDNPQVREAGLELGKTAVTITRTINNVLLPLAAFNFAVEKARIYFAEQFPDDMARKAKNIPQEAVIEPKSSVAGPALQGLAFCHEEQNLKEMYLNLLASAMDGRVARLAHPAFVEIIKQIDAEEAKLLQSVLATDHPFPIAEVFFTADKGKFKPTTITLYRHLLNLQNDNSDDPAEDAFLPAMVDNWIRLGLVNVDYGLSLVDHDYDWVESRPEFILQRSKITAEGIVTFHKGVMKKTAWGLQFSQAAGLSTLPMTINQAD
ncbi:DUF4393 domain-containing protein [Nitrosovibrio sp. Nv4]|uniref:DUF4393 domain-containing protein n=1 Tax=Nitrosovibrio sp. Nv4 TaxID=1945880 RepID=UPI000BDA997F|nr:DUF4393 domain-containing protein [Nitrosovibrio sp. Nv4]SOD41963.1 protein of unknown function [Nitrosovibrio sp. Nv4]